MNFGPKWCVGKRTIKTHRCDFLNHQDPIIHPYGSHRTANTAPMMGMYHLSPHTTGRTWPWGYFYAPPPTRGGPPVLAAFCKALPPLHHDEVQVGLWRGKTFEYLSVTHGKLITLKQY